MKNKDFIDKWKDDPDFFYLIGVICADGNIRYPDLGKPSAGIGYVCRSISVS